MIGAISGYDSIFSIGYSPRAAAVGTDFNVPESALTSSNAVEAASSSAHDPIQDSVELSRDFPQMVVGQTYAPPMEQQIAFAIRGAEQSSGMADSRESADYLNDSNVLYTGTDVEEQAQDDGEVAVQSEEGEEGEESVDEAAGQEERNSRGQPMSEEERQQVRELADRDREVRQHESAHKSVGGQYAGGMSFEYEQGPDGQRYAVGGEVSIDISAARDPDATIAKMQQVKAAAMAPADPSAQDYKVAAQATQMEAQARQEAASSGESGGVGGGEGGVEGVGGVSGGQGQDSEGGSSGTSAVSGSGVASLQSGNNRFAQRYQQMASMESSPIQGSFGYNSMAANSSYRPINIVA